MCFRPSAVIKKNEGIQMTRCQNCDYFVNKNVSVCPKCGVSPQEQSNKQINNSTSRIL